MNSSAENGCVERSLKLLAWLAFALLASSPATGQGDDRLIGVWNSAQSVQTFKLLIRSDGRYQLDVKSTDPAIDLSSTERGRYQVEGPSLSLTPYDYVGRPEPRHYQFQVSADLLSLTNVSFGQSQSFQ
jgi:hypothetical protein